jgi:hypothetical protein
MSIFSQMRIDQLFGWRLNSQPIPADAAHGITIGFCQALGDRRLSKEAGSEPNVTVWERRRGASNRKVRQRATPQTLLPRSAHFLGGAGHSPSAQRISDVAGYTHD